MNEEQQKQVYEWFQQMQRSSTIPISTHQAIKARFIDSITNGITLSSKVNSSENQGVNEAGSGSYSVLAVPDAFLQVSIDGTTYYIPVYS